MSFGLIFLIVLIGLGVVVLINAKRSKERELAQRAEELEVVKKAVGEDVTSFGEEVADLDVITAGVDLDTAARQDYQRALEAYDTAKETLERIDDQADVRHVTEALEDGRYAAACVRARVSGESLPVRRPPCFFNPQHGPSVEDIDWAPAGGQLRPVPVCAADAERVAVGAEPAVRKVATADGHGRRAYWEAGPAYSEYNRGYFNAYAGSGLLPGVLMGAMLFGGFGGGWDGAGAEGLEGGDMGGGEDLGGGDFGGDGGGDFGDFGGFDF
ncbi:hypothetical protein [Brevibacterium samyangense]|uniref:DUF1542 domain-containing protein n=1 Tax=Brevibacterium samyangense TaxID=366888 RepID=A0ABP5EPD4_9MICO